MLGILSAFSKYWLHGDFLTVIDAEKHNTCCVSLHYAWMYNEDKLKFNNGKIFLFLVIGVKYEKSILVSICLSRKLKCFYHF